MTADDWHDLAHDIAPTAKTVRLVGMLRQLLAASLFLLGCTQARPGTSHETDAGPAPRDASPATADAGGAGGAPAPHDASPPSKDAGVGPTAPACQPEQ